MAANDRSTGAGAGASLPAVRLSCTAPLAALALAAALAGCGKSEPATLGAGPHSVAPPSAGGVLGVATKNTTRVGPGDPVLAAAAVARTVYPGLTATTRPQAVVLVNERNWAAALASSALASAPLSAPLLYSEGDALPPASQQALEAMHPAGANTLGGTQVIEVGSATAVPAAYHASAAATGSDPATAAASLEGLVSAIRGTPPRSVIVLAIEAPRAYQMPAAGLAAESGAPILLVGAAGVPPPTAAVLGQLHGPHIYLIDAEAISPRTRAQLARYGPITDVSRGSTAIEPAVGSSSSARPGARASTGASGSGGASAGAAGAAATTPPPGSETAVENAIAVARFSDGTFGWGVKEPGHGLVFASSARPLDAPAAAPLSASGDYGPLLLLEGPGALPLALGHYLSDIEPAYSSAPQFQPVHGAYNHGWLIGGEEAISAPAQAEIDSLLEIAPTQSPEATSEPTSE
jgi:hypothetical protein